MTFIYLISKNEFLEIYMIIQTHIIEKCIKNSVVKIHVHYAKCIIVNYE